MLSLKDFREFTIPESIKVKGGERIVELKTTFRNIGGSHDGETGTDTRYIQYEGATRMKEFIVFSDETVITLYNAY